MRHRYLIWTLLAMPAVWILQAFVTDSASYGQTIHRTGLWSVAFLIAALSITPLSLLFSAVAVRALLRHRRALGVASFAYASLHTAIYLERKWGAGLILMEGLEPSLASGWLALLMFLPLALTSNDTSVRALGPRWKSLHRLVYPAAALTFTHWILATFDTLTAYMCAALVVVIEGLRFAVARRK